MDKVAILCSRDRDILYDFSGRCFERLPGAGGLCFPLPFLRTFLNANVEKEAEKDRLVIEYSAGLCSEQRECVDREVAVMFELTREVDRVFLRKVSVPSLSLKVDYDKIAPLRTTRIRILSRLSYDLLQNWEGDVPVETAVRKAYTEDEFRTVVTDLFRYYNEETRVLSGSLQLFGPLRFAMDPFVSVLHGTMEKVAKSMTDACVRTVYRRRATA